MMFDRLFDNQHTARTRQMFADQFEPNGKHFLYRKHGKGASISVTAEEREHFLKDYDSRWRKLMLYLLVSMLLMIVGAVVFLPNFSSDGFTIGLVMAFLSLGIAVPFSYWMWNAPARELEGRPVVGEPLTNAQFRRKHIGQFSYGYIAGMALFAVLPVLKISRGDEMWTPENLFWAACAGLILISAAVITVMKWCVESRKE